MPLVNRSLLAVLFLGLTVAHQAPIIPTDWITRAQAGQLLFSSETPGDGFFPPYGNGFISGDAGCSVNPGCGRGSCGSIHLAGVFNNRADSVPHRADVPSPYAVTAVSAAPIAAAVDLERGLYMNRSVVACPEGHQAELQLTTYAHRALRSLLVLEVLLDASPGQTCTVTFDSCSVATLHDFNMTQEGPNLHTLTVKSMEQPPAFSTLPPTPPTAVGCAIQTLNHTVTLSGGSPQLYVSSFHSSLELGLSQSSVASAALQDLQHYGQMSAAQLRASHTAAWAELWEGGVEIGGNNTIAASVNSSLYYILSAVRADWPLGLSPGGLARDDYEGHSFWDCETWMFPNMAALYPPIAQSLAQYRQVRLPAARERARVRGLAGAMQPWESALLGFGVSTWRIADDSEIHISGDVPMAFRLYYRSSKNDTWITTDGWPLVRDAADFFVSRAVQEPQTGNWTWLSVIPPDEGAGVRNSSAYTNAIAAETMRFAAQIAHKFGLNGTANWTTVAENVYLPVVSIGGLQVHAEYEGYSVKSRPYINQADVALLQYPLGLALDSNLARNDLLFYQERSSGPSTAGFYTGDSAYSIAWLKLGNRSAADAQFDLAFEHMDMGVFNVWKEKSFGDFGNLNFITGAGGYLQNFVYGYAGLQYTDEGLELRPCLPPHQVSSLVLRGLALATSRIRVEYNASSIAFTLSKGQGCSVGRVGGQASRLDVGIQVQLPWSVGDAFTITTLD